MIASTIVALLIAGQPIQVDISDFPYVDSRFVAVLVDQESSNGTNMKHEAYNQGKYGYLVGFTKGTYQDIERMSKTSLRYRNLLAKLNFDTPEGAIRSGVAYANHLMRDFGTTGNLKDGSSPKNIGMVDLYKRYNGGGSPKGVELFKQKYEMQK